MSQSLFSFPLISDDLRCEESILQASQNLKYLNTIFENTIQSLTSAIDKNAKKMVEINDRLSLIDYKLTKIKGSNKAIQIYSGSKYPIDANIERNTASARFILKDKVNTIVNANTSTQIEQLKELKSHANSNYTSFDEFALKNRQQFYKVENIFNHTQKLATRDLGNLLADRVNSVSSLLLFNTAQHL